MKYIIAIIAVIYISIAQAADIKALGYKYNDDVMVYITSAVCPAGESKIKYPFEAKAIRSDGESLSGCYNKKNDHEIQIQWNGGDTSIFPADEFR